VWTLVASLAFLAFGGIPIALALRLSAEARSWPEVPIEVLASGIDETRSESEQAVLAKAHALYRYRVGSFAYTGSRIGVHPDAFDNVGDWHERWARRLAAGRAPGGLVLTARVNPANPDDAVLDPEPRLALVAFHALFLAVGVFMAWIAVRAMRAKTLLRRHVTRS
jgi:hypothetical protein